MNLFTTIIEIAAIASLAAGITLVAFACAKAASPHSERERMADDEAQMEACTHSRAKRHTHRR